MSLNNLLNPQEEPIELTDDETAFQDWFSDQRDILDLDFWGNDQSQASHDANPRAILDSSLDDMHHGVQDFWTHTFTSNQPPLNNLLTQEVVDGSSSDSGGPLSHPESWEQSTPLSPSNSAFNAEQVCYGMIHHLDVKLPGEMDKLVAQLVQCRESTGSGVQRFNLKPKSDHVLLSLPDGTNFGYPRDNFTKVLCLLLPRDDLEFEGVALYRNIFTKIFKANKPGDAIVQVDVNIYGPPEKADEIGEILSKAKAWLQKPEFHKRDVIYKNPHMIKFPEIHASPEIEMTGNEPSDAMRNHDPDIARFVSQVQTSTNRAAGLERATADQRLKTKLLEHQETALAFMLERESGDIKPEFRLWRPEMIEGREIFIHRITKARSSLQPEENGGGILADEMGMGKTLSILSLLLKTKEEGIRWAESKNNDDLTHSDIETYAQSTLIIVPSELLINSWVKEIQLHLGDAVQVIKYHGDRRERDPSFLAKADIVLTTYKTLATDFVSTKHRTSPLHSMGWFRVVLDEAHNIRRPATTYHKACVALSARSRWCLSGTPIQNRLEDIGALFCFLKVEQFHSMARFKWYLVQPFEQNSPVAVERLIMLYDSVVLRRTKDVLVLPGQENRIRELDLSPEERSQYEKTAKILNRSIRQFIGEHEIATKFGLFQAHLQLRIFCNHGTHQKPFSWKMKQSKAEGREALLTELGVNAERVCAICRQPHPAIVSRIRNSFEKNCGHIFCQDCLEDVSEFQVEQTQKQCPLCGLRSDKPKHETGNYPTPPEHEDVTMADAGADSDANVKGEENDDSYFNHVGYSTKMKALVEDVKETLNETVVQDNGTKKAKSIIFSCWTRTLNLIELYLKRENIEFLRVDGEMLMSKRQQILDRFSETGGPQIMLMTTGTGAFGLNLTAANRIFIVELQWNPSVENQAIARAIRLRQQDKVIVTRYLMKDTVEQQMRGQQKNKERAAKAGFDRGRDDMDCTY